MGSTYTTDSNGRNHKQHSPRPAGLKQPNMITKQDLEKDTELTLENLAAQIQKRGFEAKIEKGFVSVPLENSSKFNYCIIGLEMFFNKRLYVNRTAQNFLLCPYL